jgi:hypothetical protein
VELLLIVPCDIAPKSVPCSATEALYRLTFTTVHSTQLSSTRRLPHAWSYHQDTVLATSSFSIWYVTTVMLRYIMRSLLPLRCHYAASIFIYYTTQVIHHAVFLVASSFSHIIHSCPTLISSQFLSHVFIFFVFFACSFIALPHVRPRSIPSRRSLWRRPLLARIS